MAAGPSTAIRVGIVGVGFGRSVLVPAFRADPRCEVTALCATTSERAKEAATRLGVPKAFGDWRRLLDDPEVDALAIATPAVAQPEIAVAAFGRRKPVLCEKPLATARGAAAEMLRAARAAGTAHMVDFEFREVDAWRKAKAMLEAGALGRLRHCAVSWHVEAGAARAPAESWKHRPAEGGGVLNLFGSHTFDYLEWLLGPIERLAARLWTPGGAEAGGLRTSLALLTLQMAGGVPVSVSMSNAAPRGTGHRLECYGEEGSLVLENRTADHVMGFQLLHGTRTDDQPRAIAVGDQRPTGSDGRIDAVGRLAARFLTWIQTGVAEPPTLEEGFRVQCLLDATQRAHETGRWIEVPVERVEPVSSGRR